MKTTLDIQDALLLRAKRIAKRTGRPLRALVEDGLRHVLAQEASVKRYDMPDCSVGDPADPNPLEALSWQDLREVIYAGQAES